MAEPPAAGRPRVAVVGGGIAGLVAAWQLTGGAAGPGRDTPSVVVLEADGRFGGKLATAEFDGGPVDVGPDGFLGRRPEAASLCRELGLGQRLVPVGASGAAVWARGRRRPLPGGLALGVPTRVAPVARSGILSPSGVARLALDVVAPRPATRGRLGDRAIGPLLARKLGHQAVDRLVEPMLGGIHAGGLADASAAALYPNLVSAAQGRTSLMRTLRRQMTRPAEPSAEPPSDHDAEAPAEPLFWALSGGLAVLTGRLVAELARRGAGLRDGSPVRRLERAGGRWVLRTASGDEHADAVVLAVPAGPAADLLDPHDAEAAAMLRATEYASVAVVTFAFPDAAVPDGLAGTGLLVPRATPLPRSTAEQAGADRSETCLVTACTYLWAKWPHLARPAVRLVRASVGRFGDERFDALDDRELAGRVAAELGGLVGISAEPLDALVTRWPRALPQYRVHHLLRVGGVEAAVRRLGALAVAGAAYHGVGIPACVASGTAAARDVAEQLRPVGRAAPV